MKINNYDEGNISDFSLSQGNNTSWNSLKKLKQQAIMIAPNKLAVGSDMFYDQIYMMNVEKALETENLNINIYQGDIDLNEYDSLKIDNCYDPKELTKRIENMRIIYERKLLDIDSLYQEMNKKDKSISEMTYYVNNKLESTSNLPNNKLAISSNSQSHSQTPDRAAEENIFYNNQVYNKNGFTASGNGSRFNSSYYSGSHNSPVKQINRNQYNYDQIEDIDVENIIDKKIQIKNNEISDIKTEIENLKLRHSKRIQDLVKEYDNNLKNNVDGIQNEYTMRIKEFTDDHEKNIKNLHDQIINLKLTLEDFDKKYLVKIEHSEVMLNLKREYQKELDQSEKEVHRLEMNFKEAQSKQRINRESLINIEDLQNELNNGTNNNERVCIISQLEDSLQNNHFISNSQKSVGIVTNNSNINIHGDVRAKFHTSSNVEYSIEQEVDYYQLEKKKVLTSLNGDCIGDSDLLDEEFIINDEAKINIIKNVFPKARNFVDYE